MSWRGLLTLVLLVAAAVSGWSVWKQRPGQETRKPPAHRSDYLLHEFELVVLDGQGREAFTLRAPQLARNPEDQTMTMATPLFVIPPRAGSADAPWEVRAKQGWISAEGDELRLRGDVVASSTAAHGPVRMNTEQLNVYPEAKRAVSPVAVTVTQPGSILHGHGMEAQLDRKRVLFKSNVKVRYAPSRG
jgi:lipopolysaccharide export system protein LptC